ncbi:single-stranded-DNA-specific exonuclease RecJ, partial [Enterococcus hirae]
HQTKDELPLAYALIHPALTKHPQPHPSGSGVVYKLIHALEDGTWEDMASDTALAMLGTVADLVELRGENRALTQLGL